MATRATYKFQDKDDATTNVYIHFDGYPQGAAVYFNQLLTNPSKGNLATQFIRANPTAEITVGHDFHSDTEFHYDINGASANADLFAYSVNGVNRERKCIFSGKLFDFINQNSNMIENFKTYKKVELMYDHQIHNQITAEIALRNPLRHLQLWKGRLENSANWQSCVEEVKNIVKNFPELKTGEVLEFIS